MSIVDKLLRRKQLSANERGANDVSLQASIYTSSEEIADLSEAVNNLIVALGYEVIHKQPPERGSWFQKMRLASSSSTSAKERVERLERAIEAASESSRIAKDSVEAEAISRLINSLVNTQDAVVQVGSILIVKTSGNVLVRQLSQEELTLLLNNPEVLRSPEHIVELIGMSGQTDK